MKLRKYVLKVRDESMFRQPQTIDETFVVEVSDAKDAIEIGKVRHNFPYSKTRPCGPIGDENRWNDWQARTLVDIREIQ